MTFQLLHKSSVVTSQLRSDIPDFKVGCIVSVHYKIKEGDKERIQIFSGLVINKHGGNSLDASFTVMKNAAAQIKVTRNFPMHSPMIAKVELVSPLRRARRANIRNMAELKDPAKVVRTKPLKALKIAEVISKPAAVKKTKVVAEPVEVEVEN
jgi:large subunit ribosomal protein L19